MTALSKALVAMLLLWALVAGIPVLAYVVALGMIEGRPTPVHADAGPALSCRNQIVTRVRVVDAFRVRESETGHVTLAPGHEEAAWVARSHLSQLPRTSMLRWHFQSAALHVWIVRHWTPQQITDTARLGGACRVPRRLR